MTPQPPSRNTRRNSLFVFFFVLIAILLSITANAQTTVVRTADSIPGTTVVIAGKKYNRSGYHNFLYGKHYRKEWNTAIRVNNFYLDTANGGLKPTKPGGSRQTMGLRLEDKNGKEYVLRSVDKDFGNGLPDQFHGTFIARIAKDQASIGYPFAAATITPMIAATGIYYTKPVFVFVPHQNQLGQYDEEYGNQLYMFEERPDENQENAPNFGNSKNVIGTEKLYEHVYEDHDYRVNQKAFVKARLFDMMIGDWGRHADQWRWASFKDKDGNIEYKPIPRDRDQAYTRFDGFYPSIAANLFGATQLESYNYHISNTKKFNMPGRPLDKVFLNELEQADWIKAAEELQASLTDAVIENAVKQLPPELYKIRGEVLTKKLISHRDDLVKDAKSYYNYLSHHVDLQGSQKREKFEINRISSEETSVKIFKINKNGVTEKEPYYSRLFKENETKEIRIYSLEKEDVFEFKGIRDGVKIRIIDPDATDSLNNMSMKSGKYGRTKISAGQTYMFDTAHTPKIDFFILPLLSPADYKVFDEDPLDLFTTTGLRISANIMYMTKPWRKEAYKQTHLLSANYGFTRGAINVGYVGKLNNAIGKVDILLKARMDIPAVENYFGNGDLSVNNTKAPKNYYAVKSERIYGAFGIGHDFGKYHYLQAGVFYQSVKVEDTKGRFINMVAEPSIFTRKQFAGAEAAYDFDHTNSNIYPTKGFKFSIGGGYVQDIKDNDRSFFKGSSSVSFYLPLSKSFTIAVRGGGATMDGEADYYHLNILGGNQNLRGYPRERFYAKSIFFNNNEIRWVTNTHNFFFTGKIGLLGFVDNGRIWQPGEMNNKFHTSYGGGLILIPFNKVALVGTYGISTETTHILLQANVFF
jgi:hypothetical protein